MRIFVSFLILISILMSLNFAPPQKGDTPGYHCAGSGCHLYQDRLLAVRPADNFQLKVYRDPKTLPAPISAFLVDSRGEIVDYQKPTGTLSFTLQAPRPGDYLIFAGCSPEAPIWDSLRVAVKPSTVNIPSSRFSTATLRLFPPHPNPAAKRAVLRFILPHPAQVEISLFTLTGIFVRKIFSGPLEQGIHAVRWETRDAHRRPLANGTYLCELSVDSRKTVQQLRIMR